MKKWGVCFFLVFFLLATGKAFAEWTFQFMGGSAWSIPTPLTISQSGYPDLKFTADYETKPFYEAPYYAYRLEEWRGKEAWGFELIHHKLYLTNPPSEVQHFEVSHGYNYFLLNRAWIKDFLKLRNVILRLGLGLIIAHPESTVRNKNFYQMSGGPFGTGYFYMGGFGGQVSLEKRFYFYKKDKRGLFLSTEGKFTAGYAVVPVAEGEAKVPNLAVHFLLGLGFSL